VCAHLAEAWRKRRYRAAFIAKVCDSEGEAAESQTSIEIAVKSGYVERETAKSRFLRHDEVIAMLASMIMNADKWLLSEKPRS
jgi:four helix bundle protein